MVEFHNISNSHYSQVFLKYAFIFQILILLFFPLILAFNVSLTNSPIGIIGGSWVTDLEHPISDPSQVSFLYTLGLIPVTLPKWYLVYITPEYVQGEMTDKMYLHRCLLSELYVPILFLVVSLLASMLFLAIPIPSMLCVCILIRYVRLKSTGPSSIR